MITFSRIADSLENTSLDGEASVRSLDDPGEGSSDIAEVWFEGPVNSTNPVIADADANIEEASATLLVEELSEQLTSLLQLFDKLSDRDWAISDDANLASNFEYEDPIAIGSFTTIGRDVEVGKNVRIGNNVTIQGPADIGDHVEIYDGVRIESPVRIGNGTIIHSNTVIGADGYGYDQEDGEHKKIPQIGSVDIGSAVEIGAGVAIDRATYGSTKIGDGSKLDNHVHVAHNCEIGRNCLLVAKSGLAGSVTLGDDVVLAGMAAVEDHNTIADGVIVAAKSGVTKNITEEGSVVSGFPARDHTEQLKIQAALRKLPQLREDVRQMKPKSKDEGGNTDGN